MNPGDKYNHNQIRYLVRTIYLMLNEEGLLLPYQYPLYLILLHL